MRMATSAASDNEPLLRDMVSRLCALAAQTQPALAPALASITEAARNNLGRDALESAFAKLGAAGKPSRRDTVLRDSTDGRLIDDIFKQLTVPSGLEPLATEIHNALDKPADDAQRRHVGKQLVRLLGESRAHAERRQAETCQCEYAGQCNVVGMIGVRLVH